MRSVPLALREASYGIGARKMTTTVRVVIPAAVSGLVAAFIVKSMPLETLRWLVFVVVVYAAAVMLRAAWLGWKGERMPLTPEAAAS